MMGVFDQPHILELFGRQFGLASVRQLGELGLDGDRRLRARKRGLIAPVGGGVVRMAGAPESFEGRAMGAQLAAGPGSCLSSFTAGSLDGVRKMPRDLVHVLVHERTEPTLPPGAVLHRSSWIDPEVDLRRRADGLVVTSPLRTLFTLAADCSVDQFGRAAEDYWRLGLVSPEEAAAYLAHVRRQGRTGVRVFARWLERVADRPRPTGSGAEFDLLPHLRAVGLPDPVLQHPVTLLTGATVHLDIAYLPARLAVEPGSSWFHGGDAAMRSDYERDAQCGLVGWQVMRFDEVQLRAPRYCARQVLGVYQHRRTVLAAATIAS
jgi:very-short-patch-repair endonuclease